MRSVLFASMFASTLLASGVAAAATIEVKDAWIRTPPPGAPTAAGYATLVNHGISSDRLTGARASAATSVVPHQMSMAGGIMRMRPMTGGAPIGASASLKFTPNGDHLMLIGLKTPLKAGTHVKITLQFQRAGAVAADFVVRDAAPAGGLAAMHM
jgi:periplasmic copper chaperone A